MDSKVYKFRVSYKIREGRKGELKSGDVQYRTFAKARRNYKHLLLECYRNKELYDWQVCLNRCNVPPWEAPLFQDSNK